MVYNVLRRERPEPEGRASHRSVTDGGRGLLTVDCFMLTKPGYPKQDNISFEFAVLIYYFFCFFYGLGLIVL
ncbi:MAG: hypothetical protein ACOCQG_01095 [Candidatus Nanoarchaeia archaeon]